MKITQNITVLTVLLLLLGIAGCMPKLDSKTYGREEVRNIQNVTLGTILNLRPVRIDGSRSGVGAGAGAIAGGAAGASGGANSFGDAAGAVVGAVIGAVAVGLIGTVTEEGLTRTDGVEMIIKQDGEDGRLISIVQEVDPNQIIRVGDRVYIIVNSYNKVRIAQTGQNIADQQQPKNNP
ncbi:hypothetical protein MTZ49_00330 [Entomomonas sp. E2T0]|uniref:outer membrane lipoprotein n=1 Tax=Entomomonas sp. E2T0 TaxID=2930213 RepID=UPI0022282C5C|nr:hypothetical protein [Entomomonas sp. E2T0]UYZ84071.1 hypothetical protein MTZ49_00330 [Entomomonas sp. E2T0]